jgi:hypothetical protein
MTEEREQCCGNCWWWMRYYAPSQTGICFRDGSDKEADESCLGWESDRIAGDKSRPIGPPGKLEVDHGP